MGITKDTDKDDIKVKGDDGTHGGKLIGVVDDCLKVNVCNSDDVGNGGSDGDFFLRVAKGLVPGHSFIQKFGHNDAVSNSNFEDIWDEGGKYVFQTTAQTINVSSDDNSDTSAGTGARTINIHGLDANYDEINETVNLNGTSTVTTSLSFLRVFRMRVLTAGALGYNDGKITASYSSTGDVAAAIDNDGMGENQTLMAIYTVPAGKTAYLQHWFWTQRSQKNATVHLKIREFGSVFQTKSHLDLDMGGSLVYTSFISLPEKSDILIDGKASTGSHSISAGFDLILVDN